MPGFFKFSGPKGLTEDVKSDFHDFFSKIGNYFGKITILKKIRENANTTLFLAYYA